MHRHMRQAADRDSVPPGIQDRGRETYRNTRKHREAGREADWRQARRGTRNTGLYRGRPGLAQAPWNRQGSRQDDSKDSALGIQDCAGGQSGTRAGAVKRARQRTGNGAKVRSCRPLAAGRHPGRDGPKKRSGRSRIVSGISGRAPRLWRPRRPCRVRAGIHGWA